MDRYELGQNGSDAFWSVKLREIRKLFQCRPFPSMAPWQSPPTECLTNEPRCIALLHLPPIVSTTIRRRDRPRNIGRKTAAPPTVRGVQGDPTEPRQRHSPILPTDLRESSPKGPAHAAASPCRRFRCAICRHKNDRACPPSVFHQPKPEETAEPGAADKSPTTLDRESNSDQSVCFRKSGYGPNRLSGDHELTMLSHLDEHLLAKPRACATPESDHLKFSCA